MTSVNATLSIVVDPSACFINILKAPGLVRKVYRFIKNSCNVR